ncbi:TraM recognition domain-containing protein [Acaricomes phytoseiuli]|uniref:TraM recognition domain-containing protein n=1 Tax=Acaricomes phytoseiuli TaxID=291968 RepID=UPI0012E9E045
MLMTEGGGTEITTMPVLQSLAHAREKWSNNATETIWDASIVKIILSSTPNSLDLQNLTTQRSIRRMAIMPADVIHTLAIGTGVILLRAATPIVAKLCAWMRRRDNSELRAQRAVVEESLRQRP